MLVDQYLLAALQPTFFLCYSFHAMLYSINVISVITECSVLRGCAAALNASGFHVHVEAQTGLRRDS